jgi:hypothetical protein
MPFEFVPLLPTQRRLQGLPRTRERFDEYLRTMLNADRTGPAIEPFVLVNPMAKDHVTTLLDEYLAFAADGIAATVVDGVNRRGPSFADSIAVGLVLVDDAGGGWTNRAATECHLRFPTAPPTRPRWRSRDWVSAVLWSGDAASERTVREAVGTTLERFLYQRRHGPARSLREKLAQEGAVLVAAGCDGPTLDDDDLDYTRAVLTPYLDSDDEQTTLAAFFGDDAAKGLGHPPLGLSRNAGFALALHDAKNAEG